MDLLPLTVQAASPHKVSPITRNGCTACHPELAGSDSEEKNAPVIIAIHPDEVSHVTTDLIVAIRERAHRSPVPVAIHWDHGGTYEQVFPENVGEFECGGDFVIKTDPKTWGTTLNGDRTSTKFLTGDVIRPQSS